MFRFAGRTLALSAAALALSVAVLPASPAFAYNDSFSASTPGGAGVASFVDSGNWPGGGTNDDFVMIHDYESDGYGVVAYAWENKHAPNITWAYIGWKVNKNGLAGAAVYWDPFSDGGNIYPNDGVKLKVCLLDRNGNAVETTCRDHYHYSVDG
ncbi:hypothetical protein AB0B10_24990 [Micromonospora arborensis]|uniref:hypothetical protein n=1 Tax=Micromonospora arborensis TaxID=2116518 RepID=UPI00340EDBA5